jgi:tRNA pseudouridine-54 N-methylase
MLANKKNMYTVKSSLWFHFWMSKNTKKNSRIHLIGKWLQKDSVIIEIPVHFFDYITEKEKKLIQIRKQRDREVEEARKSQWYTSVDEFMKSLLAE